MTTITVLPSKPKKLRSPEYSHDVPVCDQRDIHVRGACVKWGSGCVLKYDGGLMVRLHESWVLPGGRRTNNMQFAERVCMRMADLIENK